MQQQPGSLIQRRSECGRRGRILPPPPREQRSDLLDEKGTSGRLLKSGSFQVKEHQRLAMVLRQSLEGRIQFPSETRTDGASGLAFVDSLTATEGFPVSFAASRASARNAACVTSSASW